MADATAMIRTCATRQSRPLERVIRWNGTHVTVDGDLSFRIEVWVRAALAEAVLRLAGLEDSTPKEVEAFVRLLPIGSFEISDRSVRRWRELYRQYGMHEDFLTVTHGA